ncbi:uncharacterized protein LOC131241075 isoform X2 [Magnolia sinica]|nr:uncharacterized protein LOC131241075 isoform X2 [Magnolia sinica]
MAQEEQQRCSNSSSGGGGGSSIGGGRSCKKLKQKKIPQRGLGVAQLEKIRLEELQKKDAAAAAAGSPHFLVPLPHHPPCLSDLPSPNSIFKTSVPFSNLDLIGPPPVPPYACDGGGSGGGRGGHGFLPVAWNGLDADKARKLDHGFQFHPHLPEEVHPILRYSAVLQRNQQQQPSLLASASTSPSSSSGVNLQMEPPSNQSYCSNPTPPPRAEEERMVGMKRPWPFSLDNPLSGVAPFHCKLPPSAPIHDRWDESSCGWRDPCDPIKFSSGNSIFRDGSSTSFGRESPTKNIKENGSLDGEFLTLGPPISSPNLKSKQPISIPASHYGGFNLISLPGSNEDMFIRSGVPVQQQTFYSFLPVNPKGQTKSLKERKGEGSESVDLNLKL